MHGKHGSRATATAMAMVLAAAADGHQTVPGLDEMKAYLMAFLVQEGPSR